MLSRRRRRRNKISRNKRNRNKRNRNQINRKKRNRNGRRRGKVAETGGAATPEVLRAKIKEGPEITN